LAVGCGLCELQLLNAKNSKHNMMAGSDQLKLLLFNTRLRT